MSKISYRVRATSGAVDVTVHAGPRARAIATAMASAGAAADPGATYSVHMGRPRPREHYAAIPAGPGVFLGALLDAGPAEVVWDREPCASYVADGGAVMAIVPGTRHRYSRQTPAGRHYRVRARGESWLVVDMRNDEVVDQPYVREDLAVAAADHMEASR